MKVLLIDGQGGKIGRQLVEAMLRDYPEIELTAVGTNSLATSAMLKGGARQVATGENAVRVGCREADVIVGPIGIVMADAMLGEITPAMAVAVAQSRALKLLLPVSRCNHWIAGLGQLTVADAIADALRKIGELIKK